MFRIPVSKVWLEIGSFLVAWFVWFFFFFKTQSHVFQTILKFTT